MSLVVRQRLTTLVDWIQRSSIFVKLDLLPLVSQRHHTNMSISLDLKQSALISPQMTVGLSSTWQCLLCYQGRCSNGWVRENNMRESSRLGECMRACGIGTTRQGRDSSTFREGVVTCQRRVHRSDNRTLRTRFIWQIKDRYDHHKL